MAAQGTKYSNVNFSIPEGADPLGIGVPDLGYSSYDPIESIRSGWEASRQERMQKRELEHRDYQSYLKAMPTVDGVNKNISSVLNKDLVKMGELFQRQQKSGPFARFAKDEEGNKVTAELSRLQSKIAADVPIYNHYSEQYRKDMDTMRNGANKDRIDWELTDENVKAATEGVETVEDFAKPFADNKGSLVVWRPEESDMIAFVKKSVETFAPGMDVSQTFAMDPTTGKLKTTTTEEKDQKKVFDAIVKGYDNATRAEKGEIKRMYAAAPEADKMNGDGVVMGPAAWYASKYAPEYGKKKTSSFTAVDDGDTTKKTSGIGTGIPRREDGSIDVEKMADVMTINTSYKDRQTPVKRTKWSGEKVYRDPVEKKSQEPAEYNTISLPLTGMNKPFEMYMHGSSIDTQTGEAPPLGKSAVHTAVRIDFMPTWKGDPIDVVVDDEAEDGTLTKKTYTINPGDRIPKDIEEQLQGQGASFKYEPYLMTSSVYGASLEEKSMTGDLTWEQYISRNGKTTIVPWDKAKRELMAKMKSEKYNPEELEKQIQEIYNQLNSVDQIFK